MPKRNPLARELRLNPLYRARRGKTRHQAEQRADRWSRAAKHKPPKGSPGSAHGSGDFFGWPSHILRMEGAPPPVTLLSRGAISAHPRLRRYDGRSGRCRDAPGAR